jgi:hypothetical protein
MTGRTLRRYALEDSVQMAAFAGYRAMSPIQGEAGAEMIKICPDRTRIIRSQQHKHQHETGQNAPEKLHLIVFYNIFH